jgi:hypothetical protein
MKTVRIQESLHCHRKALERINPSFVAAGGRSGWTGTESGGGTVAHNSAPAILERIEK